MAKQGIEADIQADLRTQALSQLTGRGNSNAARPGAAAALGVLHGLASSPATAADALALLHELQVHQVELDVQEDELRRSRAELEATLARQSQLFDFAPVGVFAVDRSAVISDANQRGARLLGCEHEAVLGQALDSFLASASRPALLSLLSQVGDGIATSTLRLMLRDGSPRTVHAAVSADPAGRNRLVALIEVGEAGGPA